MKYLKTFEMYDYDINSVGGRGGNNNKKELLEYINRGGDINARDSDSNTPLIRAVQNDKSEIVNILIKAGADLNMHNNKGKTALIEAAFKPNMKIIFMLIDAGAQWNIVCWKDKTIDEFLKLTNRTDNFQRRRYYEANDFFDRLTPKYQEILKEKYPDKYAKYLAKKEYSK